MHEFVTSKTKRQNYFQNLRLGGCASLGGAIHMSIRTFFGGALFLAVLIGGLTALGAETSVVPGFVP
jgi:hypothetical protein